MALQHILRNDYNHLTTLMPHLVQDVLLFVCPTPPRRLPFLIHIHNNRSTRQQRQPTHTVPPSTNALILPTSNLIVGITHKLKLNRQPPQFPPLTRLSLRDTLVHTPRRMLWIHQVLTHRYKPISQLKCQSGKIPSQTRLHPCHICIQLPDLAPTITPRINRWSLTFLRRRDVLQDFVVYELYTISSLASM